MVGYARKSFYFCLLSLEKYFIKFTGFVALLVEVNSRFKFDIMEKGIIKNVLSTKMLHHGYWGVGTNMAAVQLKIEF